MNTFDVRGFPELGLPLLHTADGPLGVRNDGPATVMAGGISLASTWDTALAEKVGTQIARDARGKGKHFLLGPGVNIYRSPLNGRNFEYFGEDPFLASRMAVGYITGVQSQGVAATVKHFMGNNSEFDRHNSDSVIDERTMREIYLPAFEAAVKEAHVAAVMDSYNLINGEHLTQNGRLNNEILKEEWGFDGVVMSDWDATYDAVGAANGGLDLEMPSGKFLNREKLLPAIKAGDVTEEAINDKVRRIVRTELRLGWTGRNQQDLSISRYNLQGRDVALQAAREGMVLLKNDGNLLPLSRGKIKTIAVIGPDAYPAVPGGGGSAQAVPFHSIAILEGLSNYLGTAANVTYVNGLTSVGRATITTDFTKTSDGKSDTGLNVEIFENENLSGKPAHTRVDQRVNLGVPFRYWLHRHERNRLCHPDEYSGQFGALDRILRRKNSRHIRYFSTAGRILSQWRAHVCGRQADFRQLGQSEIHSGASQPFARSRAAQSCGGASHFPGLRLTIPADGHCSGRKLGRSISRGTRGEGRRCRDCGRLQSAE